MRSPGRRAGQAPALDLHEVVPRPDVGGQVAAGRPANPHPATGADPCLGHRRKVPRSVLITRTTVTFRSHNGGVDPTRASNGAAGGSTTLSRRTAKDRLTVTDAAVDQRLTQIIGEVCAEKDAAVARDRHGAQTAYSAGGRRPACRIHRLAEPSRRVALAAGWRALSLTVTVPTLPGTSNSWPLAVARHCRSSDAVSRTSPAPGSRPWLPMAQAGGFLGLLR
jgi:hypothetical protein